MAVRLASKVHKILNLKIDSTNYYCDNSSVLGWIRDSPSRWRTFVCNRVTGIQSLSNASEWRFVPSRDNPADILSRGLPLTDPEIHTFWFKDPKWLRTRGKPEEAHEIDLQVLPAGDALMEKKKTIVLTNLAPSISESQFFCKEKFSSLLSA